MRFVLYGLGKLYKRYKDSIPWDQVIAVSDSNIHVLEEDYPVMPVYPERIAGMNYDYVVVFSNKFFDEIRFKLIAQHFVEKDKIISWKCIFPESIFMRDCFEVDVFRFVSKLLNMEKCVTVLDVGMEHLSKCLMSKDMLGAGKVKRLDGFGGGKRFFPAALYDHIYDHISEVTAGYDLALVDSVEKYTDDELKRISTLCRMMVVSIPPRISSFQDIGEIKSRLCNLGKLRSILSSEGLFCLVENTCMSGSENISIYVVLHKLCNVPDFYPYEPLCVGGFKHEGYLSEDAGENIAYLNLKINECTALYWMWKNSKAKYIGLNHYRRYFCNDSIESIDNLLDAEHVTKWLSEADILLPCTYPEKVTVRDCIYESIAKDAFSKGWHIVRNRLKKRWPSYADAFDYVMGRYHYYMCNMFVTRKEILDEYCSWLFEFLIDAAEEFDIDDYDDYSKRTMGFFAERMLTVWLCKTQYKVKTLPFLRPSL